MLVHVQVFALVNL